MGPGSARRGLIVQGNPGLLPGVPSTQVSRNQELARFGLSVLDGNLALLSYCGASPDASVDGAYLGLLVALGCGMHGTGMQSAERGPVIRTMIGYLIMCMAQL